MFSVSLRTSSSTLPNKVVRRTYLIRNNTVVFSCTKIKSEETFGSQIADLAKLQSHLWKVVLTQDVHFKRSSKAHPHEPHGLARLEKAITRSLNDNGFIPDLDVTSLSNKVLVKHCNKRSGEREPTEFIDLKSIQKLSYLGDIVITDSIAVELDENGEFVEVHVQLDEVMTASLLAKDLSAQGLVVMEKDLILRDRHVYLNSDSDVNQLIKNYCTGHGWDENKRRKLRSVFETVMSTKGWAVVGSEEHSIQSLLELQEGTWIAYYHSQPPAAPVPPVNYNHEISPKLPAIESWTPDETEQWLVRDLHINRAGAARLKMPGSELLKMEARDLREKGMDMMASHHITTELFFLQHDNQQYRLQVAANPYSWPYNKRLSPNNTALIVIDMQNDFLSYEGYISQMGYDVSNSRKTIEPVRRLVQKMRERGFHIVWTREGHTPNLSDCYPVKYYRSRNTAEVGIGDLTPNMDRVLVRGCKGFEIVDELLCEIPKDASGQHTEVIIDKLGKGSFVETQLETVFRTQGIQNIIFTGLTTDVCVHTTMREAGDRGFECLLVSDCTQSLERNVWSMALRSVQLSGGIFGATCNSSVLLEAIEKIPLKLSRATKE
eukprot:TRINITY_DN3446_c0_g1_i1.p1 TRINITY_DN3446_c0_g1~~TRINITY_DN3446_c0_g1_i1.p1  ORF type:complete len:605 (-),score=80.63 TRINITY_DN3446_c0_g1_i1:117-1931(-)